MLRRLLLVMLLMILSSGPVYAEWVKVNKPNNEQTYYIDLETIRRRGEMVKMWELDDFSVVQHSGGVDFLSRLAQEEWDCAEERVRLLALSIYSGNMGAGKTVYSTSEIGAWRPVRPGSVGLDIWKLACAKP